MSNYMLRPATMLATVIAAGCQMQANTPQALSNASRPPAAVRHASSSNELFVGDTGSGNVYVFPIQNGLPVTTPARTLQTGIQPLNIAVAADGTLYVAGISSYSEVAVYAPGAQGSDQPERVLETPNEAWSLAVDAAGFLYAGVLNAGVEIYAPGAQGVDQPVATIPERGFTGGLGVDTAGNLYVTNGATGLTEYATPESDPTMVRSTCFSIKRTLNGVALNAQGTAFVAVDDAEHDPRHSFISPVGPDESGCPFKRHRLYAKPAFHNPIGIGELNGRVFVSDPSYGNMGPAVVVMNESRRAHRAPEFVLTNSGFRHPRGVAIGP